MSQKNSLRSGFAKIVAREKNFSYFMIELYDVWLIKSHLFNTNDNIKMHINI